MHLLIPRISFGINSLKINISVYCLFLLFNILNFNYAPTTNYETVSIIYIITVYMRKNTYAPSLAQMQTQTPTSTQARTHIYIEKILYK